MPQSPIVILVSEQGHVSATRRAAVELAQRIGFSRMETYDISTGVAGLADDLLSHATQVTIILSVLQRLGSVGLQIIARDSGSSAGLGQEALPSIMRFMDELEVISAEEFGTRIVARKWLART